MATTNGGRWEAFFVATAVTLSATTNAGGPTTVTITAGTYTPTSFCAHLQSVLNAQRTVTAGAWTVTLSTGRNSTGLVTIAVTAGTFSISWTSTVLRDLLGFTANITTQASATATNQHVGLWLPDCPITLLGSPSRAHKQTDNRATESPDGLVITHGGTKKYQHKSLSYSHVLAGRTFEGDATTAGASLEQWLDDTQFNDGHSWFKRGAAFQVYWDNAGTDTLLGDDLNSGSGPEHGWAFSPVIADVHDVVSRPGDWLGMWSVRFGRIVSRG